MTSVSRISKEAASRGVMFSHVVTYVNWNGTPLEQNEIEITFNGTYTIKITRGVWGGGQHRPPDVDVSYISDIHYLPQSVLDVLSCVGGGQLQGQDVHIRTILHKLFSKTLPTEKKEITKLESEITSANETIRQLRAELANSYKRTDELTAELACTRESIVETQKTFHEIQDKNTELIDIIVDQLQKINHLQETNQELLYHAKTLEEYSLDTMLESAFIELDM